MLDEMKYERNISVSFNEDINWYFHVVSVTYNRNMNMEHWWNDTDKRKPKYWQKNL